MNKTLEFYERPILIRTNEEFIYSTLKFNSLDKRVQNLTKIKNKSPTEWFLKDIIQTYPHLTYYKNSLNPIKRLETIFIDSVHKISKEGLESGFDSETINLQNILYIMDVKDREITGSISKLMEHNKKTEQEALFRFKGIKIIGIGNNINERYDRKTEVNENYNKWVTVKNVKKLGEKITKQEQEFLKTYLSPGPKTLIINQLNLLRKPEITQYTNL
ncbi:MAG: hypothetical protein PF569_04865 [Candidatus Woesearchaeota archaeon]|jgi:hypothetical protein|nr:hypothetical protein [Candidatus Woesearchaeota archaeon]